MSTSTTTEHLLTNAAGREYRMRVWQPSAPDPAAEIATLLFLDGQWLDETLDTALAAMPRGNIQVASLGYRVADRRVLAPWRAYDYTPAGPRGLLSDPRTTDWSCGGADDLLDFLQTRILPLLASATPSPSRRVALFGHSYAGLFSLYCWLQAPSLFNRIYSASPSLWWYWPHMLTLLQARHPDQQVCEGNDTPVHLFVGTDERWRPLPATAGAPRPHGVSTMPFAQRFYAALQGSGHNNASLRLFEGQTHGPMLHSAACYALEHSVRIMAPAGICG